MLQSMSSASSAHSRRDEVLPHGEPLSSNAVPIASLPEPRRDENVDPPRASRAILTLKRLIPTGIWKTNKDPASHELDRLPGKSHPPPDPQSLSQSPERADATNQGPSWMAAGQRKRVSALLL